MLSIKGLSKRYYERDILRGIDLTLSKGEVVGLLGRSGAGKSTLARCLVGLEQPDQGCITLGGQSITPGHRAINRKIQYLWQDPARSLSPYLSAHRAVLETLNGFRIGPSAERANKAAALLEGFGISQALQARRPHALSGGQCQRVALARALAAEPELLILDEPLSALDLTTQIQAVNVLRQLHAETDLTMLVVSHDLSPLRQLATRVLVLDNAELVEDLPMAQFSSRASYPLAKAYAETLS